MFLTRINAMGMTYQLSEHPTRNGEQTFIRLVGTDKSLVVNHKLEKLSAMWYKWQMRGEPIQQAFSELKPAEREFLLTGITPTQWDEIFSEEEN